MTEGGAPRAASPTLATGAVGIIYDRAVLGGVMSDLQAKAYRVAAFDCRRWANPLAAIAIWISASKWIIPASIARSLPTAASAPANRIWTATGTATPLARARETVWSH